MQCQCATGFFYYGVQCHCFFLLFFLGGGLRDNLDSMPGRAGAATRKVLQPDGTQFCKCFAVLFCAQFCKFRVIRCMKHRTK